MPHDDRSPRLVNLIDRIATRECQLTGQLPLPTGMRAVVQALLARDYTRLTGYMDAAFDRMQLEAPE